MKKLLTVFTAAGLLVAGGSSALALNGEDYAGELTKQGPDANWLLPGDSNPANPNGVGGLTGDAVKGVNNHLKATTEAKFPEHGEKLTPKRDKDGKIIPGEFVVTGKPTAKKAPAKAGASKAAGRALPKTSAVK